MDEDKTEWVTIKIPEETREKSRDDPRTYGEVMEAGLEVPSDDLRQYEEFVGTVEKAIHDATSDGGGGDSDVTMDVADELAKLRDILDDVPERTADQLEGRFR